MLQLIQPLINKPVLSLRTGGVIGQTLSPIINPNNLKIEGFYCEDRFDKGTPILLTSEIRELLPQGFVVNDHESFSDPEDLVRLKDIVALRFELMGKPVVTVGKEKVGKVNDYALDDTSYYVTKMYVAQPLLKSLSGGQLSIDRDSIVEITNKKIVIKERMQTVKTGVPSPAYSSF